MICKPEVIDFMSFGEVEDKAEFVEQLTMHLKEANFEDSKDPIKRRIQNMVNLIAPRKLIMKSESDADRKRPTGERVILTEFILPGILNKMA